MNEQGFRVNIRKMKEMKEMNERNERKEKHSHVANSSHQIDVKSSKENQTQIKNDISCFFIDNLLYNIQYF